MNDATARIGTMATEAMDLLIEAVEQPPPESWDPPSNREDWSVRDLGGSRDRERGQDRNARRQL